MRLTSSRAYNRPQPVPKMPRGLVELMDGLARDVLMHNPTNVYEFCATHMEKLLEIRDGPSSTKSLTLEQKILKAQEKMRQKAQERRERFDKDIKLQYNDTTIDHDVKDTPLLSKDLAVAGPSLRVPIHHEVDLKHASEVEISHIPQVEKTSLCELQVTDNLNVDKTNHTEQDSQKGLTDNLMEAENKNTEIILDEQHESEMETKCINKLDDDDTIFGKVEKEVINVVHLTEPNLKEIVHMAAIDSPLQTITEASEENFVNDSAVILPKITIGEDGHDPDNITDASKQEMQLDIRSELIKKDFIECSTKNTSEILNKFEKNNSNVVPDYKDIENDTIIPENNPDQEKNMPDFVQKSEIDYIDNPLGNKLKQKDDSEVNYEITQISNSPAADSAEANPDGNNQQVTSSGCSSKVSAVETHNTDIPNLETPLADVPDVIDSHDGDSADDPVYKDIIKDKQTLAKDLIENSNVSEKEAAHDPKENYDNCMIKTDVEHIEIPTENDNLKEDTGDEHTNMTTGNESNTPETDVELVNVLKIDADSNESIDTFKIEPEILQHTVNADEVEQHNDNTEIPLQKSDSAGNTNEDSISMIESDLSKTDDESTQNNPNMDLETAAVTIQKVFRSFMFKSRNSTFEDTNNDEHNSVDEDNDKKEEYYAAANLNKERRPLGITRMDTVLQTVNEEKSLSLSTDDSSTLSSAATTIQAHVRGFLVRNRFNSSKTFSMNSLVNSHEVLETDPEQHKNKTILNIHIVPEEGNYLSRDESLITSMDLSLDGSPPSSVNLHPLSCDISERRKMLKREDAVQSVSPPSNNSGKLSEDSVKEVLINENDILERAPTDDKAIEIDDPTKDLDNEASDVLSSASTVTPTTVITISRSEDPIRSPVDNNEATLRRNGRSLSKLSSDESDVITPFVPSPRSSDVDTKLVHSGEFHDVVLPTKVSRNDTSAVREFKNVLVYLLVWNHS